MNYNPGEYLTLAHLFATDEAELMWSYNGMLTDGKLHLDDHPRAYVTCNDTFGWATADCEEIQPGEVWHVLKAYQAYGNDGLTAWVCAKRDTMPFDKWMEKYGDGFHDKVLAVQRMTNG